MSLPILRSHTSDPRPWLEPSGQRFRDWHSVPGAGARLANLSGRLEYRDADTVPHAHPASRVLGIIRETWDDGDTFGSAMEGLWAICEVLTGTGVWGVIPQGWGYSPGAGGASLNYSEETGEGYLTSALAVALGIDPTDGREPSTDEIGELLHAGVVMDRLVNLCRLEGSDY